jgi:hypothetical protein
MTHTWNHRDNMLAVLVHNSLCKVAFEYSSGWAVQLNSSLLKSLPHPFFWFGGEKNPRDEASLSTTLFHSAGVNRYVSMYSEVGGRWI